MWKCIVCAAGNVGCGRQHLSPPRLVYDKFHVLRHANEAVDETCRAEFFPARGRGPHPWQALAAAAPRRFAHLDDEERATLEELLAHNRWLAKAHLLKEQLGQLWSSTDEAAAHRRLTTWLQALRWQRLPAGLAAARPGPSILRCREVYCSCDRRGVQQVRRRLLGFSARRRGWERSSGKGPWQFSGSCLFPRR
jgi:hypothetical protein